MGTCCWARRPSSSTLVKILFIDLLKYISFKSPPRSTAVDFHSEERRSGVGMEFVCDQRVLDTRVVSPSLGRLEFILFEFLEKTRRSTVGFFTRRSGTQRTGWRLCVTKGFQIHSGNFSSTCLFQIRLVQIFFQDLECVCTREQRSGGRDGVCVWPNGFKFTQVISPPLSLASEFVLFRFLGQRRRSTVGFLLEGAIAWTVTACWGYNFLLKTSLLSTSSRSLNLFRTQILLPFYMRSLCPPSRPSSRSVLPMLPWVIPSPLSLVSLIFSCRTQILSPPPLVSPSPPLLFKEKFIIKLKVFSCFFWIKNQNNNQFFSWCFEHRFIYFCFF